ncbi:PTS galactitol transporter subunit IIC [Lacticaseibacillus zeae]|uniref:PTS transporter subunit IIC n=1 Tax=Lacticaseibacillus zeae subsp. silagei TaxID=3068307 RepID=A0ABD7ZB32_LACZE|nr:MULTISPECIES: PTS transporter subunit IIC [Lacticaseibacillus]MDE3314444.1 PTS galactitol transporter subunit IIC [Lacticaseibacillus zeae]WLV84071.1 PTS transporter subunit IIC [Lacticaseibacillus sp. NCIMB 15475]WLV86826.1 PTS transporter subunit IIC [Lacticaseibacillus sp. NCIMB 15474]
MIAEAIHWFINLGSTVFIPVIIFVLGLCVRLKPSKAFISGITIGIGFIGLNLVVNLLQTSLGPAIKLMVSRYGLSLSIIDLGSGPGGPLAFSSTLGVLVIPIAFGSNLLLIWMGMTKTLNIDVWNLWQPTFIGLLVWGVTGNYLYGILAMIPAFLMQLFLADLTQPMTSKFFGLPGISITHLMALSPVLLAWPLNWLFDRIPGFKKIDASPETIQKRFGILGEPIVIGLIIGIGIGILAGYDVTKTSQLAMEMAAVLKLLPKMISMFMESLTPIAEATQAFTEKHLHGKIVNIGMDAALTVGHPSVAATSFLMIPVALFLAVILPGNKVLPFGDLPLFVFVFTILVAAFKGNIIRSLIGGAIYTIPMLYLSTWLAPLVTKAFKLANYNIGNKGTVSFVSAGLWPNALMVWMSQHFSIFGIGTITVIMLGLLYYLNVVKKYNSTEKEVN